jgi:lipopolysaccharide/colanic/teichoic acid biosynthesis glycosyltransferase
MDRDHAHAGARRLPALARLVPPRPVAPRASIPTEGAAIARPRRSQRLLDVTVATAGLLAFAPLLPVLALAIKLDSPGPVFYTQERIGHDRRLRRDRAAAAADRRRAVLPGRPFRVLKLRTMAVDAERHGPQLAAERDPRVTRLGRFLRLSRLDEVPQFWNVLRGEMSVVGPRPERLCFIRQFEPVVPGYRERLAARPGITGLAQIENGYDTDVDSVRRKVALDRRYISEASWWTDVKILIRTVRVVCRGSGAR